ncbi:unnamed protein product [Albugo candida]|uniref:Uncharacterized protein n=1 Tax=Albugo candida TaxID=65357 RepID=A0A024GH53_9STRA|nr:unnamed protein product [Albugo candida]|eukprot:CCI46015.1 unnamed protein product [Albugo candida]
MKDSTDIDVSDQLGWTKHYVFHSQEEKLPDVMLSFDKSVSSNVRAESRDPS